jgi:putative ABC transport system substrate-binding protein
VLNDAARALGVTVLIVHVQHPEDLEGAFATIARERAGALLFVPATFFDMHRSRLLRLVQKSRLPAISYERPFVLQGGLMSYVEYSEGSDRRAAAYVDKILKGAKPADLPVEQPTKFELVINLKTAKALGLTIPPSVLARADEVIQ